MTSVVLRAPEAAKYLGLSESTLAKARMRSGADCPPWVRLEPRIVGYRVEDLNTWLESRRRKSTVDPGAHASAA